MNDTDNTQDRGLTTEQIAAAGQGGSVSGFGIALRATRMALTRVFRRFFLPYQPAAS